MSSEDGVQERNRLKAILEVVESEKVSFFILFFFFFFFF